MSRRQHHNALQRPRAPWIGPFLVVAIYLIAAFAYIPTSDWIVERLVTDPQVALRVHTFKGLTFVGATGVMLYFLVGAAVRRERAYHRELDASAKELRRITATVPGVVLQAHMNPEGEWSYPFVSDAIEQLFGMTPEELQADPHAIFRMLHPEDVPLVQTRIEESQRTLSAQGLEFRTLRPEGRTVWIRSKSVVSREPDGSTLWHSVLMDITDERRREALREGQGAILRMLIGGAPLEQVLESVCRVADEQAPAQRCIIFTTDESGRNLQLAAAPGMPTSMLDDLTSLPIGPGSGASGTAAFERRRVVCEDVATDPLFANLQDIGNRYNVKACCSTPIFRSDGAVLGTVVMIFAAPRAPTEAELSVIDAVADFAAIAITQRRSENALRESEARYRSIIEDQTELICRFDPDGAVKFANNAFCRFFGLDPYHYRSEWIWRLIGSDQEKALRATIRGLSRRNPVGVCEHKLRRHDGEQRVISWTCRAMFENDDGPVLYQAVGADVTALKTVQEEILRTNRRQTLLLDELDHRVKNSLSGLLSLISLSEQDAQDVRGLADSMRARVEAMTAAHSLLSASHWRAVPLTTLLRRLMPGDAYRQIRAEGEDVNIPPRQVTALGMIFQELMTNSVKYGALSVPTGSVSVTWAVTERTEEGTEVRLRWLERDGPRIVDTPQPRLGLGLINGFARSELGGSARVRFGEEGIEHELHMRLDAEHDPHGGKGQGGASVWRPASA